MKEGYVELCKACKVEHIISCCKCCDVIQRDSEWKILGFDYSQDYKPNVDCLFTMCKTCYNSNPDLIKQNSREHVEFVLSILRETTIPETKVALVDLYFGIQTRLTPYIYPYTNFDIHDEFFRELKDQPDRFRIIFYTLHTLKLVDVSPSLSDKELAARIAFAGGLATKLWSQGVFVDMLF